MLWLIKKPCEQLLWRVGPVNSGSPYASAVRKDFPAGMRFSSGNINSILSSTEMGLTAASASVAFLFHGGREVDARNPDAGLGDGVSPMHRLGGRA